MTGMEGSQRRKYCVYKEKELLNQLYFIDVLRTKSTLSDRDGRCY